MNPFWGISGYGGSDRIARSDASDASREAGVARRQSNELENRLNRTLLACEAMWSLMRGKLSLTDEELVRRINDIDLSDGKLDGKVRKQAVACPKCNRTISPRFPKCLYCGQAIVHDPFA